MNNVLTKTYSAKLTLNEFLEESKIFVQEYSCPLCEGILNDSVIDNCGHSYCRECLMNLLKETNFCPFTNKEIIPNGNNDMTGMNILNNQVDLKLSPNIILTSAIEKQKVFCKNYFQKPNCNWTGKLADRKNHLLYECENELVDCEYSTECDVKVTRDQLQKHLQECPYRIVLCYHCKQYVNYISIEIHYKTCPNLPLECPNDCGEKVPASFLNVHLESKCSNSVTECPYNVVGCEFYDLRKLLKVHVDENLETHLKLINNKTNNLEDVINKQNQQILNLNKENSGIKEELEQHKNFSDKNSKELWDAIKILSNGLENMKLYSNILMSNLIPCFINFSESNKMTIQNLQNMTNSNSKNFNNKIANPSSQHFNKIFQINQNSICKISENSGWFGISSKPVFPQRPYNYKNTNNSYIDYEDANEKLIINMKIKRTVNSCIMFGITFSEAISPLRNGYYTLTDEKDSSYMFYTYNSSVYYRGRSTRKEEERACLEGDIISLIIDIGSNTISFRKNGIQLINPIEVKYLAYEDSRNKMKIAVDMCDYMDHIVFLE